jgi:hypothetical protein
VVVVQRLPVLGDERLALVLRAIGRRGGASTRTASSAASTTAAIRLAGSATPLPAMSNAVP